MMLPDKDFKRVEGAYVTWEDVPGTNARLFTIERVNGDCSVDRFGVTAEEARIIATEILKGLKVKLARCWLLLFALRGKERGR